MPLRTAYFIGNLNEGTELQQILSSLKIGLQIRSVEHYVGERRLGTFPLTFLDFDSFGSRNLAAFLKCLRKGQDRNGKVVVLSSQKKHSLLKFIWKQGTTDYIFKPYNHRELISRISALINKKLRVVCLGGGTGLFTLLSGLKNLPNTLLISVVIMSDDGGSSGRLRTSFGILPPGDIRRSLVALSNAPEIMNQIIQYRFKRGGELKEHSFGNLMLTVLSEIRGSMGEAVRTLGDFLNLQGIVLPVTSTVTKLVAQFENGTIVRGESRIDTCQDRDVRLRIKKLWHEPEPVCDLDAYASLLHADAILIGPGDLYTSLIANLAIKQIREVLALSPAKKIYLCNLMTKPGETHNYFVEDHISEIIKYVGHDVLDYVLVSKTRFSKASLKKYAALNQFPVLIENPKSLRQLTKAKIVFADLANEQELVRHDSDKTRREIAKIFRQIS